MNDMSLIDEAFVNTFIKKRALELHKGQCGKVLIIGGSKGMAGAAMLSARGALRSGAGIVRVSIPYELYPILQIGVPEATCISRSLPPDELSEYQAIVIGPGLGDDLSAFHIIKNAIDAIKPIIVLDADALNLTAAHEELKKVVKTSSGQVIMTPHPGEAARLLGTTAEKINEDRRGSAIRIAEQFNAVIVLKGAGTIVATPDKKAYINTTGNSGMATGGSGDVLSGIIAALAGQGCSCLEAAACGAYIHGSSGDIAACELGEYGVIASDIAAAIGLAIKRITRS
jgi:hydroxyethylthiazole kinase-like uncharacterized protein yjeF